MNASAGDYLSTMKSMPNGFVVGASAGGAVWRASANDPARGVLEGQFGGISSIAVTAAGEVFLATATPFFFQQGALGQVFRRSSTGNWFLSLDHPLGGAVVAAGAGEVYAFSSEFGSGADATVSVLTGNSPQWSRDVASLPSCQINQAVLWNNDLWAGGCDNTGQGGRIRVFRGTSASFSEVLVIPDSRTAPDQLECCTQLFAAGAELYLATGTVDASGALIGGLLYTSTDGATWTVVKAYVNNAPMAVTMHEGTLFVGLFNGELERRDARSQQVIPDPAVPANRGVMSFHSVPAGPLLLGVRGSGGAELFRRRTLP